MAHTIEPASSGRARCRGCGKTIAKAELRFGERLPNPFADGEMTLWFHLPCAAFRRPESLLEVLADNETIQPEDAAGLRRYLEAGGRVIVVPSKYLQDVAAAAEVTVRARSRAGRRELLVVDARPNGPISEATEDGGA